MINKKLLTLSLITTLSLTNLNATDKLDKQLGQMFMLGFNGTKITKEFCQDIYDYNLGGVIIFGKNIKSKEQLKKMTKNIQSCSPLHNVLIAVDQEGGKVMRLRKKYGFQGNFKSAQEVSKLTVSQIEHHYSRMAKELTSVGINYNLAPDVDLDINKKSYIIHKLGRSFGENPKKVAKIANIFIDTHNEQGVLTSLKHFPGHGSATGDTHKGFVDITKTWKKKELEPYKILKDRIDSVMVAHVTNKKFDKKYPASLSKKTIDGILRDKIGYQGVVISDDMMMGAVAKKYKPHLLMELFINAGGDILIFGNQVRKDYRVRIGDLIKKIKPKFKSGELTQERINLSLERIRQLKSFIGLKW